MPALAPSLSSLPVGANTRVEWQRTDTGLDPFVDGEPVAWAPQLGGQVLALACPVFEMLLEGNRGGGKTLTALADYGQHVGVGFGAAWVGMVFRRHYPDLADIIRQSKWLFGRTHPTARFIASNPPMWKFSTGETLLFGQIDRPEDYEKKHGHNLTWILFDELSMWNVPDVYTAMMSTLRSPRRDIPIKMRATTNPWGPGANWIKRRFKIMERAEDELIGPVVSDADSPSLARVAVRVMLEQNRVLTDADPSYGDRINTAAGNAGRKAAWKTGDWNARSGGMFDDIWDDYAHIIPRFEVPRTWRVDRAFDWGSSKPFSTGWYAESDGTPIALEGRGTVPTIKGDVFRFGEWYGWNGRENEGLRYTNEQIANGIKERDAIIAKGRRISTGPADPAIFAVMNGASYAAEMEGHGVKFTAAANARVQGWEAMRGRLKAAAAYPRESPGLFFTVDCEHAIRTVPSLPRSRLNPDDADTTSEDHVADEVRYRIFRKKMVAETSWGGLVY